MRPSIQPLVTLGLLLGLGGVAPGQAEDLTIVFKVKNAAGERLTTHYYTATRVRLDQGDEATLVDFPSGRILIVSSAKKQYWETTFKELEQAMTAVSAEMEKAMAGIPDSLRQKMMGDAAREVKLSEGDVKTVAGFECRVFVATLGAKSRMETCAATNLQSPFDATHFKNLALVTAPIARGNSGINKLVETMRTIEGLSLASATLINLLGRRLETTTEAMEVQKGAIDAKMFAIPRDYQKVESPFAKLHR